MIRYTEVFVIIYRGLLHRDSIVSHKANVTPHIPGKQARVPPTSKGSFHAAPMIEGLKTAMGKLSASSSNTCSAKLLVKVYVLGRLPIKCGVRAFTMLLSIQLFKMKILQE